MNIDALMANARSSAARLGWSKTRLAREAGMSDTVLRDFDRASWNPTAKTLRRLLATLDAGLQRTLNDGGKATTPTPAASDAPTAKQVTSDAETNMRSA